MLVSAVLGSGFEDGFFDDGGVGGPRDDDAHYHAQQSGDGEAGDFDDAGEEEGQHRGEGQAGGGEDDVEGVLEPSFGGDVVSAFLDEFVGDDDLGVDGGADERDDAGHGRQIEGAEGAEDGDGDKDFDDEGEDDGQYQFDAAVKERDDEGD